MKTLYLNLLLMLILSTNAKGNTFVGNGGNVGDVELAVAKKQLRTAWENIANNGADKANCECVNVFSNHGLCEHLKSLNEEQNNFCGKVLKEKAKSLVQLMDLQDGVNIEWTHKQISVEENNDWRAADAVTNPHNRTITLNQNRYLKLSPSDRVFILAHEYFHLVKWDGKRLEDQGKIGPFKAKDGQRQLINAMAAATVMDAELKGQFSKYENILERPQGWKAAWVDFGSLSQSAPKNYDNNFQLDDFESNDLQFRYYFGPVGLALKYSSADSSKKVFSATTAREETQTLGVGATLRYFPFSDPLSYWGQTHFVVSGFAEGLKSTYTIDDGIISDSATGTSTGLSLECKYFIPLKWGLWAYAGLGFSQHKYEIEQFGINYEDNRSTSHIGVSYGF